MTKANRYWRQLMDELEIAPALWRPYWRDLQGRYRESHRYYHRLRHIGHFLDVLHSLCAPARPSEVQLLAAFFHDAVYDPLRHDNEELSAQLARAFLVAVGLDARYGEAVDCLIMATAGHSFEKAVIRARTTAGTKLSQKAIAQFLDSDLAILAAARGAYKTYCGNVAREYGHLPPEQFAQGRASFLRKFLQDHDRKLYYSTAGHALFEERARHNMAWELGQLEGKPN